MSTRTGSLQALILALAALLGASAAAQAQCLTMSAKWQNTAIAAQGAAFVATFDATPSMAKMDGVTGLSLGPALGFTSYAVVARFNNTGFIDARNGGVYVAASQVPYIAGSKYHFRLAVNPAAHNYSIYVTPPGASEITLGTNYAFRSEQASVSSLNNWGMHADAGGASVCSFAAAGGTTPPDTTPPTVSMTAPASGASLSGSVPVSATAADNVGVAGVQFMLDGAILGAEVVQAPYATTWNTTSATNASHSLTAVARDAAGNKTTSSPAAVTVNNAAPPPPGCMTSKSTAWQNTSFASQSTAFTASFDASPSMAKMDGLTGLSLGAATGFSSPAVLVRFNNTGTIDARKAGAYAADASIPYSAGALYHFRFAVDPVGHTYSVWVTPPGGAETALAANYGFRTEQASVSSLNNWTLFTDVGAGTHQVCNFALSGATAPPPPPPDTTPPTISITAPASAATVSGATPVSATAADNVGVVGVQFMLDGAALGAEVLAAPYTTTWVTTSATNASHALTAVARDAAGNKTTSAAVTVTVNNAAAPPPGNYDAAVLNDKPIAFWDMKNPTGTETDLTGNGHTGTYKGGAPTLTTLPDGEQVVDFNTAASQRQYMTVASPADKSFSISTTKQLTWEAWIRPDVAQFATNAGSGYVDWMGKCEVYGGSTSQEPCEWEARMYSVTTSESPNRPNRLSAYVFNAGAGLGSAGDWQPAYTGPSSNVYASSIIQPKDWLHVVAEYQTVNNGTAQSCGTPVGTANVWVNGVMWSQSSHAPTGCFSQYGVTPSAGSSPLDIGTMAMDGWFQGAIGKVAIYNTLLSQSQISAHYAAMTGTQPSGSCGNTCTAAFPLSK